MAQRSHPGMSARARSRRSFRGRSRARRGAGRLADAPSRRAVRRRSGRSVPVALRRGGCVAAGSLWSRWGARGVRHSRAVSAGRPVRDGAVGEVAAELHECDARKGFLVVRATGSITWSGRETHSRSASETRTGTPPRACSTAPARRTCADDPPRSRRPRPVRAAGWRHRHRHTRVGPTAGWRPELRREPRARTQAIAIWLALAPRASATWLTASAIARLPSDRVRVS